MRQFRQLGIQSYRTFRLEVQDDGGDGWAVTVYAPSLPDRVVLRNRMPNGLTQLLDEARSRIDRRIDGLSWEREP